MKHTVEKDGFVWKGKTYKKGDTIEMTETEAKSMKSAKVQEPVYHEATPKKTDK